jgi:hypothetical protein
MRRSGFGVAVRGGVLLSVCALAACGGGAKSSGANEPTASKTWQDGPAPAATPAPDAKLTEGECTQLFDHIVKLMQEGMPPDEWAAGKDDLAAERPTMIQDCQDGETTRVQYTCLVHASTLAQLKDCVPQE